MGMAVPRRGSWLGGVWALLHVWSHAALRRVVFLWQKRHGGLKKNKKGNAGLGIFVNLMKKWHHDLR